MQLQSQSPFNSITNSPNPGILTFKFLPSINSCVHNCVVTVTLKVAYTRKKIKHMYARRPGNVVFHVRGILDHSSALKVGMA